MKDNQGFPSLLLLLTQSDDLRRNIDEVNINTVILSNIISQKEGDQALDLLVSVRSIYYYTYTPDLSTS